jgi:hypothetical protein
VEDVGLTAERGSNRSKALRAALSWCCLARKGACGGIPQWTNLREAVLLLVSPIRDETAGDRLAVRK